MSTRTQTRHRMQRVHGMHNEVAANEERRIGKHKRFVLS